jgi:hypothetical protein
VEIDDRVDDGPVRREEAKRRLLVVAMSREYPATSADRIVASLRLIGVLTALGSAILAQVYLVLDEARGSG